MTGLGAPSEASDEPERVPRTRSTVGEISDPCAAPGCAVGTPRQLRRREEINRGRPA